MTSNRRHTRLCVFQPDRRTLLLAGGGALLPACSAPDRDVFAGIETGEARLGISALDLSTGRRLSHRGGERFALCSTFKWLLAAFILHAAERDEIDMAGRIVYGERDLVAYSPVTGPNAGAGMTVEALCEAAVSVSDNSAANLLLARIGGPDGFTDRVRGLGDPVTRLDRWETDLNENAPGDPRDTTTPDAMLDLMAAILVGDWLTPASHDRLSRWMIGAMTGLTRLRAGFPDGWVAGDKTGTSGNGAFNDIAFARPPSGEGGLIVACYLNAPDLTGAAANAIHAESARRVVQAFGV